MADRSDLLLNLQGLEVLNLFSNPSSNKFLPKPCNPSKDQFLKFLKQNLWQDFST